MCSICFIESVFLFIASASPASAQRCPNERATRTRESVTPRCPSLPLYFFHSFFIYFWCRYYCYGFDTTAAHRPPVEHLARHVEKQPPLTLRRTTRRTLKQPRRRRPWHYRYGRYPFILSFFRHYRFVKGMSKFFLVLFFCAEYPKI